MNFVCVNSLILLYTYGEIIIHSKSCVSCGLELYRYRGDTFFALLFVSSVIL